MISSSILKLWQTHVHENNFYAPQSFISYTHSHISTQTETHISLMHDGDTRAHGHLLHEDALTCSLSLCLSLSLSHTHTHIHNKTTDLLIASVRESRHRHCYTPAWLGMVTIYIRALSDPHPPNPVPVTMATNSEPPPLQWQDCRIN